MKNLHLTMSAAALCLAGLARVDAAELALPKDGWASWQVDAVDGAPDWCCWSGWKDDAASRTACRLDDDHGNFGNRDHATTDAVRVYARLVGGKVERLRAYSATCAVEAATPIKDLGTVAADDSARWLIALQKSGTDAVKKDQFRDGVLSALAIHRGALAGDAMAGIARGDARVETRKKAVFWLAMLRGAAWLAMLRGAAGADVTASVMFDDPVADVRSHAAFALSQSKQARVAPDLIRLGNSDQDADVRADAWFWLAQNGAAQAEAAIGAAARKDSSEHVREHAVFALSRLPDERATRALIAAAEDQSLSREQRRRAVFWLAQSESQGAQTYLEKVLMGNAVR